MKNNLSGILESEQKAIKTAFLSYYISMYNSASKEIGFPDTPVTVEEIYDFIQDLKHEAGKNVPEIGREDISFCFHMLQLSGICRR
jgi:hypothetical protein